MATVARENIGLLNDKITVKVSKEDYFPTFEKKLKEYSKTVNMPGFRKGMVPAGMIKKMYGPSIYTDEILRTVEKQLYTYLDTEKPDIFAQPLALDADIRKLDFNNPADYEFGFEIGLKPNFDLPNLGNANVTLNKVKVTDEMVQEEVDRMLVKGGQMTEPDAVNSEEDVLNLLFSEVDQNGNPVETGIQKEGSVIVKYFTDAVQKELRGKKKTEAITIKFADSFNEETTAALTKDLGLNAEDVASKYFSIMIVKIGMIEKRTLDETFFNEVFPGANLTSEADFRQKLSDEIQVYWDAQSRNQLHDQIYHFLLDETKMEFPAEFLKRWLQTGAEERKTAEQAESEFPVFSSQLKWTLISDKIIKDNGLEVSQQELKESMKEEVMRYFGSMNLGEDTSWLDSYVDRMLKDEKQVDASYRRLVTDKLFNWAQSQVNPKENEVTPEFLTSIQHNHNH